jgi:hypothetical protein
MAGVPTNDMLGTRVLDDFGSWTSAQVLYNIVQVDSSTWSYNYTFTHDGHDLSHWIIEATNGCANDPLCMYDSSSAPDIHMYLATAPPNFYLPADIYGAKFNFSNGASPNVVSFLSDRAPVYGNIYLQDGVGGQTGPTFAYNHGLLNLLSENTLDFVPRPDGGSGEEAPEPATFGIAGVSLLCLSRFIKKKIN